MTEIIPNLFLGNIEIANNVDFIIKNKINCVFNCTINKPFIKHKQIKYKYRIPIKDDKTDEEGYLLHCILDDIVELINKHLKNNDIILVHCFAGRQRSPSCILGYLIKYYGYTLNEGLSYLKSKSPLVGIPEFNFYKPLFLYEKKINI